MHEIDRSVPLFFTRVRGTCIPVTSQLVTNMLHVPRIQFPDYPSCEHLRTVSRDELMSSFYESPTAWGESPTFVLHPLFHYNSITKPHA